MLRRLTERAVYGFLGWFESFNSVWQTTLLCVGVAIFEIGWPNADKHLIAVLFVSLYATFTQNGLAHENKLTSDKVDQALARLDAATEGILATITATRAVIEAIKHTMDQEDEILDEIHEAVTERAE